MRLHVAALPYSVPTDAFSSCALTNNARRFADMMRSNGHEVFEYYGKNMGGFIPPFDDKDPHWMTFNQEVINGLDANSKPGDFLCLTAGLPQKPVADMFPELIAVEYAVCYGGCFAPYRVFETHAWEHIVAGAQTGNAHACDGRPSDLCIPHPYHDDEFTLGDGRGDEYGQYLLYMGRLIERKGVRIVVEVANRTGMRLVAAGAGDTSLLADCVDLDYRGSVGSAERNRLMGGAMATLTPTIYLEPGCGVSVESQLAGTPVISSDWGAFTETVIHGTTGFRCRTIDEYVEAVEFVRDMDRSDIRSITIARYSTSVVRHQYEAYFKSILESLECAKMTSRTTGNMPCEKCPPIEVAMDDLLSREDVSKIAFAMDDITASLTPAQKLQVMEFWSALPAQSPMKQLGVQRAQQMMGAMKPGATVGQFGAVKT